ncbi:hypothetical protein [Virgibacillus phasianinus]|uniref:hypothetical protein n=1 Tax=Virgibacillus phasianinus TaxID=2017483 RepID=UPI001C12C68C|nr:hypothetical protein [Virgibacillus phasianinus]
MPTTWIIGPLIIKSSLVMLIGSFVVGFVLFKFTSPFTKSVTKKRLDEVGTILFMFVISLWIGKILTNFSIFIDDPRALLAYPSDSKAFYVAVVLLLLYGTFKFIDNCKQFLEILFSLIYVFLSASFVYEFTQIILRDLAFAWGYIGLLAVLLILIILLQGKMTTKQLVFLVILVWSLGQLVLSTFYHTSVFQFYLDPGFYSLIAIGSIVLFIYRKWVS